MNSSELQRKLLAVARDNPPGDHVPYAFEKRITALISSRPVADPAALWVRGLWQAAVSCVAVALLFGACAVFAPGSNANSDDLSQNFETTLLASVDQGDQAQ